MAASCSGIWNTNAEGLRMLYALIDVCSYPQEIDCMNELNGSNDLRAIAHKAMTDHGLEPDFPPDAIQQ